MPFNSALKSPDSQGSVVWVEVVVSERLSEPSEISPLKALAIPAQLTLQTCCGLSRIKVKGRPGIASTGVPILPAPADALEQDDIPAVPAYLWLLPISGCHAALALSAGMDAVAGMAEKIRTTVPPPLACPGPSSAPLFG